MGKSELFSALRRAVRGEADPGREYFDELTQLAEKELKRSASSCCPEWLKLVVQKAEGADGPQPGDGRGHQNPAKTVVKARIAKQLKDAVLPRK